MGVWIDRIPREMRRRGNTLINPTWRVAKCAIMALPIFAKLGDAAAKFELDSASAKGFAWGSTTCTEMCGNGVETGGANIQRATYPILSVPRRERNGHFVAVAGDLQ